MRRHILHPFHRAGFRGLGAIGALIAASVLATTSRAQTTSFQPAAAQPVLPTSNGALPVVESLMGDKAPVLNVHKAERHTHRWHEAHFRHRPLARIVPDALDRPALAGVELLQALPRPGEPPHLVVPLPAYPLDSIVTAATMPPPPIVCHPTRREPDLPDPRLYRERTVACEADNP